MNSSMHVDNKKKNFLILGKSSTQGPNDTTLTTKAEYSVNFTGQGKHGSSSYLFGNGVKIYQFKAKESELNAYPVCFGNILKDFSNDNMKQIGLNIYVYSLLIDFGTNDVDYDLNIHKYSVKKHDLK